MFFIQETSFSENRLSIVLNEWIRQYGDFGFCIKIINYLI